jgi:hypothetical protein
MEDEGMDAEFQVGDRVKLEPSRADGWLQPMRKFCLEGRLATVTAVSSGEPMRVPSAGCVRVLFDKGRKTARDVRETVRVRDLVLVERPIPQPDIEV